MTNFIKQLTPKSMKTLRISAEEFITLYNDEKIELVDVRMGFERAVWELGFGLKIPANELPDNLDKLPKDKIIVCGCPKADRATLACAYLNSAGVKSMYLGDGLVDLMGILKGGKVKEMNIFK